MADGDWIFIGEIVAPQGLKGELRVNPQSDFPERFLTPGPRWLRKPSQEPREVRLERGYAIPGRYLFVVKLAGIDDRTQAEALRGWELLVPASDRLPLEVEEYHVADLVGLTVYHQDQAIGTVTDVYSAGNDLLAVTRPEGGSPLLIPFVKAIVPVVDLRGKRIEIDPPQGLLELS